MARYLRVALAQVKVQIKSCLPTDVDGLAEQAGHVWREGKLTPAITVWLFMLQILNGNTAITALRHLGGIAMEASSYSPHASVCRWNCLPSCSTRCRNRRVWWLSTLR